MPARQIYRKRPGLKSLTLTDPQDGTGQCRAGRYDPIGVHRSQRQKGNTVNRQCGVVILAGVALLLTAPMLAENGLQGRIDELTRQLRSQNVAERRQAAQQLEELGPPASAAVPALRGALRDEDVNVRHHAAAALGEMGPDAHQAARDLVRALSDSEPSVRHMAAWSLGRTNAPPRWAGPALVRALQDEEMLVRKYAVQSLGQLNPVYEAGVRPLIGAMKDSAKEVAREAMLASAKMGPAATPAIEPMKEMLNAETQRLRYVATMCLGTLARSDPTVVHMLVAMLSDEDPERRASGALALGNVGEKAASATSALVKAMDDEDVSVRRAAVSSLGAIGPAARAAAPALIERFREIDTRRRWEVMTSLVQMGQAHLALADIREALQAEEGRDRQQAAFILSSLGLRAHEAAEDIEACFDDPDHHVVVAAARAFMSVGGDHDKAIAVLLDVLNNSSQGEPRVDAAIALGVMPDEFPHTVVTTLISTLQDDDNWTRWAAAVSLGRLGTDAVDAEDALLAALDDPIGEVRVAASRALQGIRLPRRRAGQEGGTIFETVGGEDVTDPEFFESGVREGQELPPLHPPE